MHSLLTKTSCQIFIAGVLIYFAGSLSFGQDASAEVAERPNVLFIAVDDLKPLMGAFGDPHAKTPNMDRLAGRGTAFLNAHCQQAVCAPSRVSLMLGLRPDTTKVWDLKTEFRAALPDVVTLPQRFKQAGYQAIGMGKIYDPRSAGGRKSMDHVSWSQPYVEVNSEADNTYSYLAPAVVDHITKVKSQDKKLPKNYEKQLKMMFPDGKPATDRADVPDTAYFDGAMTEVAMQWIDKLANDDKPYFLAVGYKKPHLPFNAPEKYWAMYDRAQLPMAEYTKAPEGAPDLATQPGWELRSNYDAPKDGPISEAKQRELIHGYYACVSYIDAQVGMLLDHLDASGQADNTIIVLWGDHGWHLGDHDIWCKHTNYEQATRSPLIIVDPRIGQSAGKNTSPVEFVDIYPTLLDLAGIEPAGDLHGVSLRPILEDASASVKEVAVSQYPRGGGKNTRMGYAYRSDRYRLVQWRDQDAKDAGEIDGAITDVELYDYEKDPLETRNLADDPAYAKARAEMEALAEAQRSARFVSTATPN